MEAALRSAHFFLTGEDPKEWEMTNIRGLEGVKRASYTIAGKTLNVAVVNGVKQAKALLEEIAAGRSDLHFVEVMSCPGGCIGGGGQPLVTDPQRVKSRMQQLYAMDQRELMRGSHQNPAIQSLYFELLGEPLSETSHHLLHTHYEPRSVMV
jgi:iron only hydrogenase large subunit-like protein